MVAGWWIYSWYKTSKAHGYSFLYWEDWWRCAFIMTTPSVVNKMPLAYFGRYGRGWHHSSKSSNWIDAWKRVLTGGMQFIVENWGRYAGQCDGISARCQIISVVNQQTDRKWKTSGISWLRPEFLGKSDNFLRLSCAFNKQRRCF